MPHRWHLGSGSSGQHSPYTAPSPSGKAISTIGHLESWSSLTLEQEKEAFSLVRTMAKALPKGPLSPNRQPVSIWKATQSLPVLTRSSFLSF